MRRHVSDEPRPLTELRPDLPSLLERLIMACLAKSPGTPPALGVRSRGCAAQARRVGHGFRTISEVVRCRSFVVLLTLAVAESIAAQTITTIAGDGRHAESPDGAMAAGSPLNIGDSRNVALAFNGNLCFAEEAAFRVRCIERTTGRLVTLAGGGDTVPPGGGRSRPPFVPREIAFDLLGNLFINDGDHHVRKVDRKTGIMTLVAGSPFPGQRDSGPATDRSLNLSGLTFDRNDNLVFTANSVVFRLDFSAAILSTIEGKGWSTGGAASPVTTGRGTSSSPSAATILSCGSTRGRVR